MSTVLEVRNMNIAFPTKSGERVIVKDGAFEVKSGEFVLILGENGAGKSSIFKSLVREDSSKDSIIVICISKEKRLTHKKNWIDSESRLAMQDKKTIPIGFSRARFGPMSRIMR